MHVLLAPANDAEHLRAEWIRARPDDGALLQEMAPDLLALEASAGIAVAPLPALCFARQVLPDARAVTAASIKDLAGLICESAVAGIPDTDRWRLHVFPRYGGEEGAGRHRCRLIAEAVVDRLKRQRRHLLRRLDSQTGPFGTADALVQLLLVAPDRGFLSVVRSPIPWGHRSVMSPFPAGEIAVASDRSAPSRAFAKLVEAEQRLGRAIGAGERCVDLGASPGSWSYVALQRGAEITAVDRSPLREDLHRHPSLRFEPGDAFRFQPESTVDWLLCDVIAAPERSIGLVLDWTNRRLCRRFVVTIKFKGAGDYPQLDVLKRELPPRCDAFVLTRLCANKNEACVAGILEE